MPSQLAAGAYVEIVAIVATLTQIDTFYFALGMPYPAIPEPDTTSSAAPSQNLALGQECYAHVARVPTVPFTNATHPITQSIYYGEAVPAAQNKRKMIANIMKVLSACPGDHQTFMSNVMAMYITNLHPTFSGERSISRPHMELLATKVSQLNDCAY